MNILRWAADLHLLQEGIKLIAGRVWGQAEKELTRELTTEQKWNDVVVLILGMAGKSPSGNAAARNFERYFKARLDGKKPTYLGAKKYRPNSCNRMMLQFSELLGAMRTDNKTTEEMEAVFISILSKSPQDFDEFVDKLILDNRGMMLLATAYEVAAEKVEEYMPAAQAAVESATKKVEGWADKLEETKKKLEQIAGSPSASPVPPTPKKRSAFERAIWFFKFGR